VSALRRLVSRHQLVLFYVLAYVLSWASAIPTDGSLLPHGPALAAIIVLAIVAGRRGLAGLWRQVAHWRVPWAWYLAAPGIVGAFHLGALGLNLLFGATVAGTSHLESWPAVGAVLVELLLFGGLWEEPGWTGYALPRVLGPSAHRPVFWLLAAVLIAGVLRAVWHLPLVLYGHLPWYDFLFYNLALQFVITWLYLGTRGSVLVVMLFHLASNVVFRLMSPLFAGADATRYWGLFIACAWGAVLAVVLPGWLRSRAETRTAAAWLDGRG